jgi:hypothetical protein
MSRLSQDEQAMRRWHSEVSSAASHFERRWTRHALKRVDGVLAQRLQEQRELFDKALLAGTADEIDAHGAAMCRGYVVATKAMETSGEADDAYLLGQDPKTGFRVAVGHQKSAADRVTELEGSPVVWVSVDEVAAMIAGLEGFKQLAMVKQLFPGAQVVDIRPGEPAKAESGVAA